jgi:hypothetical protein
MNTLNRGSILGAILLIGMGVLFLILEIAGISISKTWPIIFLALGAVCFLPPLLWPSLRAGLAGFCIPGGILLTLGVIFLYNTLSGDWASWSYAWIMLNGGVGIGLVLAAWIGGWGREMTDIGWWMFVVSAVVFSIFATLFGGPVLKASGPVVLILCGLWLMVRSFASRQK